MGGIETGGIPWQKIFERVDSGEPEGEVYGLSGRKLRYAVGGSPYVAYSVSDVRQRSLHLSSYWFQEDDTLFLSAVTKGFQGDQSVKHPDMYASRFVRDTLGFMKVRNGGIPSIFTAEWGSGRRIGENYRTFQHIYSQTKDPVAAALQTPAGRGMARFGYTEIGRNDIVIEPGYVVARFSLGK